MIINKIKKIKIEDCTLSEKIELHQKHINLLDKIIKGNISKIEWFEFYFEIDPLYSIEKTNSFLDEYYKLKKENIFFCNQFYKSGLFLIENKNNDHSFHINKLIKSIYSKILKWVKT